MLEFPEKTLNEVIRVDILVDAAGGTALAGKSGGQDRVLRQFGLVRRCFAAGSLKLTELKRYAGSLVHFRWMSWMHVGSIGFGR